MITPSRKGTSTTVSICPVVRRNPFGPDYYGHQLLEFSLVTLQDFCVFIYDLTHIRRLRHVHGTINPCISQLETDRLLRSARIL